MTLVNADTGEALKITAVHPVADLFPLLEGEDFDALVEDLKANGVLHPVVVDPGGVLLDGRNRLAAAKKLKLVTPATVYDGDPVPYILSTNISRRSMSKGQGAMVVAEAALIFNAEHEALANTVGVSRGYVTQAANVHKYAPDLVASVIAGKRPLNDAYKTAQSNKRAAESSEAVLAALEAEAPDLAAKVAKGELELAEADLLHKRRIKEAEEQARDTTRALATYVAGLGAVIDIDPVPERIAELLDLWRPDVAEKVIDLGGWVTADGMKRIAAALTSLAKQWEKRNDG